MATNGNTIQDITSGIGDTSINERNHTDSEAQQPCNVLIITNVPDDLFVNDQSRVCMHADTYT